MKIFTFSLLGILLSFSSISQNAPIDFETDGFGTEWTWTVFENVDNPAIEIIANPDPSSVNASSTVAKFTARQEGAPWAGCETMHGSDIGTFTIDESNMMITIMVWKSVISDVGIKLVRFDNWSLGEIKVANTLTDQWEQLTFDFSEHMDLEYDQLVVFPDFADRNEDHIIYFDNIFGGTTIPDSVEENSNANWSMFPNPATDQLTINSAQAISEIQVVDQTGKIMWSQLLSDTKANLDLSTFPQGAYLLYLTTTEGRTVKKFIKD